LQNIDHLTHLVPIFYSHFGYLFSYLRLPVEPVTLLTLSNYHAPLLNIVCALAARYSPRYGVTVVRGDSPAGNTWEDLSCQWATKAKEQAGMELAISSDEMVQTLLLISWYEFGGDRDGVSCLDMYAIRSLMAGLVDVRFLPRAPIYVTDGQVLRYGLPHGARHG
jgi:hypothetical protein